MYLFFSFLFRYISDSKLCTHVSYVCNLLFVRGSCPFIDIYIYMMIMLLSLSPISLCVVSFISLYTCFLCMQSFISVSH